MQSECSELGWYVAKLMPGLAAAAIDNFERRDINHHYPTHNVAGKIEPLMRGYALVQLPHDRDVFAEVNYLRGVSRLLPFHSEMALKIPVKWMRDFEAQLSQNLFDIQVEPETKLPWFNRNEILAIISGPFSGHTGTFVQVRKGAVEVDVTFFGRQMTVPLKGHQVQRLM